MALEEGLQAEDKENHRVTGQSRPHFRLYCRGNECPCVDGDEGVQGGEEGKMNILAIDPGGRCGWSSLVDNRIESGVQEFSLRRGESKGMRFLRFNTWFKGMLELIKPHIVVYEMAHMRGGHATEVLLGMTTRIEEFCEEKNIEYSSVHSATLKKFATGSGKANKEAMIKAAMSAFGKAVEDDNEADSLMLLKYAREEFD